LLEKLTVWLARRRSREIVRKLVAMSARAGATPEGVTAEAEHKASIFKVKMYINPNGLEAMLRLLNNGLELVVFPGLVTGDRGEKFSLECIVRYREFKGKYSRHR